MMSHEIVYLMACLAQPVLGNEVHGLGLLQNVGLVQVTKASVHSKIGLMIPTNFSSTEATQAIAKIVPLGRRIVNMPGLVDNAGFKKKLRSRMREIEAHCNILTKALSDIASFNNPSSEYYKEYNCMLTLPGISIEEIKQIEEEVEEVISLIDLTLDKTKLDADKTQYRDILNAMYTIEAITSEARAAFVERVVIMEGVVNLNVPDALPNMLKTLSCYDAGNLENIYVNFCDKSKWGLLCELDMVMYQSMEKYQKYVPINYEGAQIIAERESQMFVKNHDKWGILDCGDIKNEPNVPEDNDVNNEYACVFTTYENECTKAITLNDTENMLKNCNFTVNPNPEVAIRTENGILLQRENLKIKELKVENNEVIGTIKGQVPVLVASNNILSVKTGDLELIFKPYLKATVRELTYTFLSKDFIHRMKLKAWFRQIQNILGIREYALIILVAILAVVLPITMALCYFGIKNSNHCIKYRDSKAHKIIKRGGEMAQNCRSNKKLLRESRAKK